MVFPQADLDVSLHSRAVEILGKSVTHLKSSRTIYNLTPCPRKLQSEPVFRCHGAREGPRFWGPNDPPPSGSSPNFTKINVAHTDLNQTAWLASLMKIQNQGYLLGQKNTIFMQIWTFGGRSKWADGPKKRWFCPIVSNQRTLSTPKPPQISKNFVPPPPLINQGPPWYHSTRFLGIESPTGGLGASMNSIKFKWFYLDPLNLLPNSMQLTQISTKLHGWHL